MTVEMSQRTKTPMSQEMTRKSLMMQMKKTKRRSRLSF
jgi:hypothetical protein